jgi:hypothetical protein
MNYVYKISIAILTISLLLVAGCTTTNKYYTIRVSDKLISDNNDKFVISSPPNVETLKIGKNCYNEHVPCYNTFKINNSYVVEIGVEHNAFAPSDIVIKSIISERDDKYV